MSERPIQPLGEHRVGEPGRQQLALPSPAPRRRAPGARGQGPPSQGESARGGERRRPGGGGAGLGRLDGLFQRFVVSNPENFGGGVKRGAPLAGRALAKLPAGEKEPSCGSRIAARSAEMERVAQGGLVFGAAGAAHVGRGDAERQTPAENAGPGRAFPDDLVEAAERRAGEKGGFGFRFGRDDRARPGRQRRRRGGRKALDSQRISAREHAGRGYAATALLPRLSAANRRACRLILMSDKVALSDLMLFIVSHARFRARKRDENDPWEPAERPEDPPLAPPPAVDRADGGAGPLPSRLAPLAETARDYARAAASPNTNRAYAADWRHFSAWARRQNLKTLPPDPQDSRPLHRRLRFRRGRPEAMLGQHHRAAPLGADVELRPARPADGPQGPARRHRAGGHPPHPGPPARAEGGHLARGPPRHDSTLDLGDLRGLRDRAILLIGFAGGLRRSEIVGLDCRREDGLSGGWIEFFDEGLLLTLRGKTGWREVEIGRGSSDATCPVVALETWLKFARISIGPVFRRVVGGKVGAERLTDRHVARLVKHAALAAGVARRPHRGRAGEEILRPFPARRPRLLRRGRRALCAKAARPRLRRNDPPLSAPPRPLSRQSHQGGGPLNRCCHPLPCP